MDYKQPFMKPILLIAVAAMFLGGCGKKYDKAESLVFGSFYGMCASGCFEVYRVDNTSLAADDSVDRFTGAYTFRPTRVLSAADQAAAKDLLQSVPRALQDGGNKTYGSPDSHDQGGVYLQWQRNGSTVTAILDNDDTPDQAGAIQEYKHKVRAVLQALE